jgi:hypothetical protein
MFKYTISFIGSNYEVSIKSIKPNIDVPEIDEWDNYPGETIDEYLAQDIEQGIMEVSHDEGNPLEDTHQEYQISDILEVDAREVLLNEETNEYQTDRVLCRMGEGKGGLGTASLELEKPFNIKKVFITSVETSNGNFMKRFYYDGKQID